MEFASSTRRLIIGTMMADAGLTHENEEAVLGVAAGAQGSQRQGPLTL